MPNETPAAEIQSVQTPEAPQPIYAGAAPTVHEVSGTVQAPVAPAAPAAPQPPAPVAAPYATAGPAQPNPTAATPDLSAVPAGPAQPTAPVAQTKVMDAAWPFIGYTGPQPWEADNTPALTQNHTMLSSGSSGTEVVELAALLGYLGYGTTISAGQNPHAIYDSGVSNAVEQFCREYGVVEDPAVRRARTEDTVGPWIWEAITRAVHRKASAAQQATS